MKFTRRQFLAGFGAAGAAIGVDAFGLEAHRVLLSRHDVPVPGLPAELAGLRIAQIADVHLPGNQLAARAALEHLDRERPEVVVLNGDMTESAHAMTEVRNFAAEARGSLGTIAVLGNWEYRAGAIGDVAQAAYRQAGVDLLVNQSKTLDVNGVQLALVGLDDALLGSPDLTEARSGVGPDSTEIWVVHEPSFADTFPERNCRPQHQARSRDGLRSIAVTVPKCRSISLSICFRSSASRTA